MSLLRLLADDLTGALDTAAQFATTGGAIPVYLGSGGVDPGASAAIDSGTREMTRDAALAVTTGLADLIRPGPGLIAFKKVDSLLRGHSGAELAACLHVLRPRHCIIAPAFPFQGRVTRGGRQHIRDGERWRPVGEDLGATLREAGLSVTEGHPGDPWPEGISLWDAETDGDLAGIAAGGLAAEEVLWCGSSGLAGALAGCPVRAALPLGRPLLGLFGTDHPASAAQLAGVGDHHLVLADGGAPGAARIATRLAAGGVGLVSFDLPRLSRADAALRIGREMADLVGRIAPPCTLVAAGGETLRMLCHLLHAERLDVTGQIVPGVPMSILRGGRWDGVIVVSKSGAFGAAGLLRQLIASGTAGQEELGT